MRTLFLLVLIAALAVPACSNDSADETTTNFAPIPGVPDRPAIDVVEEMLAIRESGDGAAWMALHHPDAVVIPFEGDAF